ncbi:Hypothetical_protein [Hexamita inflata]|uniref:Hypothetical_protein n=1 Tax=Hexamita inflata TaxID=28002 RepID=A0ABP1HC41_9EUKA
MQKPSHIAPLNLNRTKHSPVKQKTSSRPPQALDPVHKIFSNKQVNKVLVKLQNRDQMAENGKQIGNLWSIRKFNYEEDLEKVEEFDSNRIQRLRNAEIKESMQFEVDMKQYDVQNE